MIDQLNMITSQQAQKLSFAVINAVQQNPTGHQVAAVALTFHLMCQHFGVNPRDVLDKTNRIAYDAISEGRGEYIRAVQNYMKEELK